jgi:hypothetical protein
LSGAEILYGGIWQDVKLKEAEVLVGTPWVLLSVFAFEMTDLCKPNRLEWIPYQTGNCKKRLVYS